jgi:uncharacterized membrane protein
LLAREGSVVTTSKSGYLQFVSHDRLIALAARHDSVIELLYRPGHFVTHGLPLARIWPPSETEEATAALSRAHVTGPYRTLEQDPVFAIDQLVEIGVRALSPAVNDPFTALTCIDWLADGLCTASSRSLSEGIHRDDAGKIRVIQPGPSYPRMVNRAYDKMRQAGTAQPAVEIRLLESLAKVMAYTRNDSQRATLIRQADMIWRASEKSGADVEDMREIKLRYDRIQQEFAV